MSASLHGIHATMFHDEGAIAHCGNCGRYTLDPKALSDRQPVCTCGKQHYWSGSFTKPGPDAQWHGPAPTTPAPKGGPSWLDPATAPKDGRLLRLLVEFTDHNLEDNDGPQETIGHNSLENTGEDEWSFAGWCWTHDCYTHGEGKVVGWSPMRDAPEPAAPSDGLAARLISACRRDTLTWADRKAIGEAIERIGAVFVTPDGAADAGFLQADDYHLLHRFIETTDDDESYDIGKDAVKRLAELGVVQSHGFGRYSVTIFGYWVHERYWHQNPTLPLMTNSDRARAARSQGKEPRP